MRTKCDGSVMKTETVSLYFHFIFFNEKIALITYNLYK